MLTVPASWIKSCNKVSTAEGSVEDDCSQTVDKKTTGAYCFWPHKNSTDEKNVRRLIANWSDPDKQNWLCLPGVLKGFFNTFKEAEAMITEKVGTKSTDSEIERVICSGKSDLARQVKELELKIQRKKVKNSGTTRAISTTESGGKHSSSHEYSTSAHIHRARCTVTASTNSEPLDSPVTILRNSPSPSGSGNISVQDIFVTNSQFFVMLHSFVMVFHCTDVCTTKTLSMNL